MGKKNAKYYSAQYDTDIDIGGSVIFAFYTFSSSDVESPARDVCMFDTSIQKTQIVDRMYWAHLFRDIHPSAYCHYVEYRL